jgi:peptidoglycan/xylan/chitin deacetylase (PgdA/CDA1 family)
MREAMAGKKRSTLVAAWLAWLVHCGGSPASYVTAGGDDGGSRDASTPRTSDGGIGASGSSSGSSSGAGSGFYGPQNPGCKPLGTPRDPGMFPQTTFEPQPDYIPKNVIVITLDDVPDITWTAMDLQWLRANNLHVDVFVNTLNWGGPLSDVQQMFADGHYVGNHTVHHSYLVTLDAAAIESEIAGVESAVDMLTDAAVPHLTRFRAPYGEPYQPGCCTAAEQALVEPIVAKYAVAFAWNFDSGDTAGITNGTALFNNVVMQIKTPGAPGAAWGIMLAHGVNQQTHDMLPLLLAYLKGNGFVLGNLEDVSCWMFGKHTWEIIPGRMPN